MHASTLRQLRSVVLRSLVLALLLAGALASHVGAQEARASVTIRVHSCPDDLDATGFYQYAQRCHSTKGLFGVPLRFSFADGTTSFLYSQPNADESVAEAMNLPTIPAGPLSIGEVSSDRIRESVVFCSLQPAGNQPPTMDGTEVAVNNGAASFSLANADSLDCDWYRFPGGVVAEGEGTEASPVATGGSIKIQKWICDTSAGDVPAIEQDPEDLINDLESTCEQSRQGFSFDLADDTEDGQDYPERTIGGQEADYMGWSGLVQAQYAISEDLSGDFDEPIVICEGDVPGRQTFARNLVQLEAHHGDVSYDLDQDETLTCEWFNLAKSTDAAGGTDTSITIYAWSCPSGTGPLTSSANGECNEPLNGLTFLVDGPDGYHSQTNTGDSIPGAVFFGGLTPGAYTVTATTGDGYDPVVVCNGAPYSAPAGVLTYDLADGETLSCDWATTEGADEGVDVGRNDSDDDGLLDVDELNSYFTDPHNPDTDGDGVGDGDEATFGYDPNNPDTDNDGLTDGDEIYVYGTDPFNPDTDNDGAYDGDETQAGTDPLDPASL